MDEIFFKAIGNRVRVKILACLYDKEKSVGELIGTCELCQSAVSQHLAYLKDAGLIESHRQGRFQIYRIKNKPLAKVCKELLQIDSTQK